MQVDNSIASVPPFQADIDDKYQPTVFDPNYWQQEAQKYAASVAGAAIVPGHQAAVATPSLESRLNAMAAELPAGTKSVLCQLLFVKMIHCRFWANIPKL